MKDVQPLLSDFEADASAIMIRPKPREIPFPFQNFNRLGGRPPRRGLKASKS
jgi:hypothetical protein